jgi:hypothetical protein
MPGRELDDPRIDVRGDDLRIRYRGSDFVREEHRPEQAENEVERLVVERQVLTAKHGASFARAAATCL